MQALGQVEGQGRREYRTGVGEEARGGCPHTPRCATRPAGMPPPPDRRLLLWGPVPSPPSAHLEARDQEVVQQRLELVPVPVAHKPVRVAPPKHHPRAAKTLIHEEGSIVPYLLLMCACMHACLCVHAHVRCMHAGTSHASSVQGRLAFAYTHRPRRARALAPTPLRAPSWHSRPLPSTLCALPHPSPTRPPRLPTS